MHTLWIQLLRVLAMIVCCECESYEDQDNCEVCQDYLWHEAWQRNNS